MQHKWFSGFDWEGLISRQMPPPTVPEGINSKEDVTNFDFYSDDEREDDTPACTTWTPAL
jgi:hypothetical protein